LGIWDGLREIVVPEVLDECSGHISHHNAYCAYFAYLQIACFVFCASIAHVDGIVQCAAHIKVKCSHLQICDLMNFEFLIVSR
jgi:hypothetical protein